MRVVALLGVLLFLGCSSGPAVADAPDRERVVRWSASISVEDHREAVTTFRTFTEESGGYVSASEARSDRTHLLLRVPSADLPALRERLIELDPDLQLSEQAEDVTEAHGDLSARLRNQRATEARLLALLDGGTATLADVLAAERELSRVREQIETLETDERALARRVALADVELTVMARRGSFTDAPLDAIASAFGAGAQATLQIALGAAIVGSALLPGLTLLALGISLARAVHQRFARRGL